MNKFINISKLSEILEFKSSKNKKPLNHILRYWEKEFKQIKPKMINNRRYYSSKQVELFKLIKFLLKDKKMTIKGAKNVLNSNINKLDDYNFNSLKTEYRKKFLKEKSNQILNRLKDLKKYGKKNPHKG